MCVCCRCICVHVIMTCLVHCPWYEPATSAEVRQKTDWLISLLSYHSPKLLLTLSSFPSFPPSILSFPHPSFHSSFPPDTTSVLSFAFTSASHALPSALFLRGVVMVNVNCRWTSDHRVGVCECALCGWADAVVCPRSSIFPSFSLTFAVFLHFLPPIQTLFFSSSPRPLHPPLPPSISPQLVFSLLITSSHTHAVVFGWVYIAAERVRDVCLHST